MLLMGTSARPDFTGTWKLNLGKSSLQIPPPDTVTVRIHHGATFKLEAAHMRAGKARNVSFELPTDGRDVLDRGPEAVSHRRMYWQGESLVLDATIVSADDVAINYVIYSLSDSGRTLIAFER